MSGWAERCVRQGTKANELVGQRQSVGIGIFVEKPQKMTRQTETNSRNIQHFSKSSR